MSIVTKTGDQGTTGLMYNRRVPKADPRVDVYGSVDELNAAIGMARAACATELPMIREALSSFQHDLVDLMGELATHPDDLPRYAADGFKRVSQEMTARLDRLASTLEGGLERFKGWVMPGDSIAGAALDMARAVCRRAERGVCRMQAQGLLPNPEPVVYLNRLGDVLWLLARWVERPHPLDRG